MSWYTVSFTEAKKAQQDEVVAKFKKLYDFNCSPLFMALFSTQVKGKTVLYASPASVRQSGVRDFIHKHQFSECDTPEAEDLETVVGDEGSLDRLL